MNKQTTRNFISVDGNMVINSYGEYFTVGEVVEHQDVTAGSATISSFEIDKDKNEIKAYTDMGYAHFDFLVKIT